MLTIFYRICSGIIHFIEGIFERYPNRFHSLVQHLPFPISGFFVLTAANKPERFLYLVITNRQHVHPRKVQTGGRSWAHPTRRCRYIIELCQARSQLFVCTASIDQKTLIALIESAREQAWIAWLWSSMKTYQSINLKNSACERRWGMFVHDLERLGLETDNDVTFWALQVRYWCGRIQPLLRLLLSMISSRPIITLYIIYLWCNIVTPLLQTY